MQWQSDCIVFELSADLLAPYEAPIPSAFVIDQTRTVRMTCVEQDFGKHLAPAMAVKALKRLAAVVDMQLRNPEADEPACET